MSPRAEKLAAVSLVVDAGDGQELPRVLVAYNRRYHGFSLPGGMVEEGENIYQAQARELEEETALRTVRAHLFFEGPHKTVDAPVHRASVVCVFYVEAVGEPVTVEEGCEVRWMTAPELMAQSPFRGFYEPLLTPDRLAEALRWQNRMPIVSEPCQGPLTTARGLPFRCQCGLDIPMREHSVTQPAVAPLVSAFHAHLDECEQCREHPFALCAKGAHLLVRESGGVP